MWHTLTGPLVEINERPSSGGLVQQTAPTKSKDYPEDLDVKNVWHDLLSVGGESVEGLKS